MKINRFDAHDRFLAFHENQLDIGKIVQELIDSMPYGNRSFYIFIIHKRSLDLDEQQALVRSGIYDKIEDTPEAEAVISARLSKLEAAPNTTLIKVTPGKESVKRIWSLPQYELWEQFEKGKMFDHEFIRESIFKFKYKKQELQQLEHDDPKSIEEFSRLHAMADKRRLGRKIPLFRPREDKPTDVFKE